MMQNAEFVQLVLAGERLSDSESAFHGIARFDVRKLPVHEVGGGIQKPRGSRGDGDLPRDKHGNQLGRAPPVRVRVRGGDAADEPLGAPADHLVDRPRSEVSSFVDGAAAAAGVSLVGDVVRVRHLVVVVLVVVVIVVVIVIIVVVDVDDDVGDGGGADDDEGEEAHGRERAHRGLRRGRA